MLTKVRELRDSWTHKDVLRSPDSVLVRPWFDSEIPAAYCLGKVRYKQLPSLTVGLETVRLHQTFVIVKNRTREHINISDKEDVFYSLLSLLVFLGEDRDWNRHVNLIDHSVSMLHTHTKCTYIWVKGLSDVTLKLARETSISTNTVIHFETSKSH